MQFKNAAGMHVLKYFTSTYLEDSYSLRDLWNSFILYWQNVKAVFDAAIKVVLQPPKQKKKKRKAQKACSIL